ncbi:MAG: hypothetical protein U0939_07850 [Pirellulales bacterium]
MKEGFVSAGGFNSATGAGVGAGSACGSGSGSGSGSGTERPSWVAKLNQCRFFGAGAAGLALALAAGFVGGRAETTSTGGSGAAVLEGGASAAGERSSLAVGDDSAEGSSAVFGSSAGVASGWLEGAAAAAGAAAGFEAVLAPSNSASTDQCDFFPESVILFQHPDGRKFSFGKGVV